ncbi:hypothetical protein RF11_10723 [Thelohanellus kitauei]|uniref:Uncharacterized protein n=1 Tax=Thelohanellus kitauei TaxID=669202 RepID=A0A0C2J3L4_THEKT|nr:hypothetical protein RF11_10723 [Thelohanellus kitauei]
MENYISDTQSSDVGLQMNAIKNFISLFSHQDDYTADHLFITKFPNNLFEECQRMSEGQTNVYKYKEKKILFFDVLTYIFRNRFMIMNTKAHSFAAFFIGLIKIRDPDLIYDPNNMIYSILLSFDLNETDCCSSMRMLCSIFYNVSI